MRIEWPPITLHFASFILSRPPRIICSRIAGSPFAGNPTIESADTGRPPIAYTSLSELAPAICPNVNGSSAIGVKKSTVCTSANPSPSRYTPASSLVLNPTSTFGSVGSGRRRSIASSVPGLSLAAQPAALTIAVSFTESVKPHLTVLRFDYSHAAPFLRDPGYKLGRRDTLHGLPGKCSHQPMPWDFWLSFLFRGIVVPWRGAVRLKKLLALPSVSTKEKLVLYGATIAGQWVITALVAWRALARGLSAGTLGLADYGGVSTILGSLALA